MNVFSLVFIEQINQTLHYSHFLITIFLRLFPSFNQNISFSRQTDLSATLLSVPHLPSPHLSHVALRPLFGSWTKAVSKIHRPLQLFCKMLIYISVSLLTTHIRPHCDVLF